MKHIFRNFYGKTKDTGKYWSTNVLLEMLSSDDPSVSDFLPKSGVLRQVMKVCLVLVTSNCDIEQVFTAFTLYDTKLNQAATPDEVEEITVIMKETPTWDKFDSMSTIIMWK